MDRSRTALFAIVIGGFALRIYGLDFGLPLLSNFYIRPDETLIVVPAVRMSESGGDPGFFVYPALLIHLCALLFQAWFHVLRLLALTEAPDLALHFAQNPSGYFLLARTVSAVAGTLTIPIVYAIGKRLLPVKGGLLAALLFAVAPLAVRDAHFAVTDTALTLLATASVYMLLRRLDRSGNSAVRNWVACAGLLGLAASTKYTALLLGPAVGWVLLVRGFRQPLRRTALDVAVMCLVPSAAFASLNAHALIHHQQTATGLLETLHVLYWSQPGDAAWSLGSAARQVLLPLTHGAGLTVGLAAALVGLVVLARDASARRSLAVIVAVLAGFLGALLLFRHPVPYRYLLPALPLLAVLAAKGALVVCHAVRRPALAAPVILVLVVPPAWDSVRLDVLLAEPDTRSLAGQWIRAHVPPTVPVVVLGGPECEPQILETVSSLERRSAYVKSLYGEASGTFISQIYALQQRGAAGRSRAGHEVFRNPAPGAVAAPRVLVVTPAHPLSMANVDVVILSAYSGRVVEEIRFESLPADETGFEFDAIDAFFLPWTGLSRVARPGPNLRLRLVEGQAIQ